MLVAKDSLVHDPKGYGKDLSLDRPYVIMSWIDILTFSLTELLVACHAMLATVWPPPSYRQLPLFLWCGDHFVIHY